MEQDAPLQVKQLQRFQAHPWKGRQRGKVWLAPLLVPVAAHLHGNAMHAQGRQSHLSRRCERHPGVCWGLVRMRQTQWGRLGCCLSLHICTATATAQAGQEPKAPAGPPTGMNERMSYM